MQPRPDRLPRHTNAGTRRGEAQLVEVVGNRQHDAVARTLDERRVDTGERGCDSSDLVLYFLRRLEAEVGAEARRELARDPPALHRRSVGRDLAAEAHDAAFEIGGTADLLAPHRRREHDVGSSCDGVVKRPDDDDVLDGIER